MSDNDDIILYDTAQQSRVAKPKPQTETFQLVEPDWPLFTKPAPEFDFANPVVDPVAFASTLVETCRKYNGFGLSANQCGYNHRVFVMGAGEDYVAYFNPKILSTEGESHLPEGCLSFPLLELRITRPKKIDIEYQDFEGNTHTKTFDGVTSRIFQHQLDYLNGIVYTSLVKPLALQSGIKKLHKIRKKYFNPKLINKLNGN